MTDHLDVSESIRATMQDLARRALRAETALLVIAEQADRIAERFGDEWPHTPACQGEPGCPLCQITYLARPGCPLCQITYLARGGEPE